MNTTTITISSIIAERLAHSVKSPRGLGYSHQLAATNQRSATLELPTITAARGSRINGSMVPKNMLAKMQAEEKRSWDHSDLAGILWEKGIRASRAIAWARIQEWADFHVLTVTPITSTSGLIRWEIQNSDGLSLASADPADKGSLHRIMSDAGYKPDPDYLMSDTWVK